MSAAMASKLDIQKFRTVHRLIASGDMEGERSAKGQRRGEGGKGLPAAI